MSWTSKRRILKIAEECLDEMYRNADPPLSWNEYKERYGETTIQGFKNHYIDVKKCNEIWEKYGKQIPKSWKRHFNHMILNYAPTSIEPDK